jgi:small-conductance mechanosensitive channel
LGLFLKKQAFQKPCTLFLSSILSIVIKGAELFTIGTIIGVDLTSSVGIFATACFAVGMAWQGNLGNFTSGFEISIVGK